MTILYEAQRFRSDHVSTISLRALHVYYSALAFSPESSLLFRTYRRQSKGAVRVVKGRTQLWQDNPCLHVIGVKGFRGYVAFSPDSKKILSVDVSSAVKVFDVESGNLLVEMEGHSDVVNCAVFSPDGRNIVSGSGDHSIRMWNATTGNLLRKMEGHSGAVMWLAMHPDGRKVVSASDDSTIRTWNLESGIQLVLIQDVILKCQQDFGDRNRPPSLSPDGRRIAFWIAESTLRISNTLTGHQTSIIENVTFPIKFSPNSNQIACRPNRSRELLVSDVETGNQLLKMACSRLTMNCLAFSPDGKLIASGLGDCTVEVWNVASGNTVVVMQYDLGDWMPETDIAFYPDNKHLASGSLRGPIRVWNVMNGEQVAMMEGHSNSIYCMALSPDARRIASGSCDETMRVWDATTRNMNITATPEHSTAVLYITFSADGRKLASTAFDRIVRVWDVGSGNQLNMVKELSNDVIKWLAFISEGKRLLWATYDNIILWDMEDNSHMSFAVTEGGLNCFALSPDGSIIASGTSVSVTVTLYDTETGKNLLRVDKKYRRGDGVGCLAFYPDGKRIAAGLKDGTVRVWDVVSGDEVMMMDTHSSEVAHLAFSSDGSRIAVVPNAGEGKCSEVWIWNGVDGKLIAQTSYGRSVLSLLLLDNTHIHAIFNDGPPLLWEYQPRSLSARSLQYGQLSIIRTSPIFWLDNSGFVYRSSLDPRVTKSSQICQIPRRYKTSTHTFTFHESVVAVGTKAGAMLILDLHDVDFE